MVTTQSLLAESTELWGNCGISFSPPGREYGADEQFAKQLQMDKLLGTVESQLRRIPVNRPEREQVHAMVTSGFVQFARTALELEDRHINLLLDGGFSSIGTTLGRKARCFDPSVSAAAIFQACRNAWAACGLQALLGKPMCVSPSILAYSLLYPYTDNYMDDASVPREIKLTFSQRFRQRLEGEGLAPANEREHTIWRLVGMIESQYARAEYPQVFGSLLAIHQSQEESLRLHRSKNSEPVDVLQLVFAKGGTSVLADAYLAAGHLTDSEARFAFQWGILLQLGDDLQDIREDLADGALTLFAECAGKAPLDEVTNRVFHFSRAVTAGMENLKHAPEPLKYLLQSSSMSLLVRAAGEVRDLYSQPYIERVEAYSPFRFDFLRERRERMARHRGLLARMFESFLAGEEGEPMFPLLPSSLMPR